MAPPPRRSTERNITGGMWQRRIKSSPGALSARTLLPSLHIPTWFLIHFCSWILCFFTTENQSPPFVTQPFKKATYIIEDKIRLILWQRMAIRDFLNNDKWYRIYMCPERSGSARTPVNRWTTCSSLAPSAFTPALPVLSSTPPIHLLICSPKP